jgi:NADH-quinone oxidoreductase subunit E
VLDEAVVDEVVAQFPNRTGDVLGILETLQKRHPQQYLPKETLALVARKLDLAASRVFAVATFYSFFNLHPQGDHCIVICRGTACHTRGSKALLDRLKRILDVRLGEDGETFTSADGRCNIRTVACFGQCALAPVLTADERIYSYVTDLELTDIVNRLTEGNGAS